MKIVLYADHRRVGILSGGLIVDAADLAHQAGVGTAENWRDLAALIQSDPTLVEALSAHIPEVVARIFGGGPIAGIRTALCRASRLHPPLASGARIACAGGNFSDHALKMYELNGNHFEGDPAQIVRDIGLWGFWKVDRYPTPPGGTLAFPARAAALDYEGEVGIVIGRPGKNIRAADWRDHVWGVTLVGDWSIRGPELRRCGIKRAKNFDGSVSVGPCIVTGEGIDAAGLQIETRVNGELRQAFDTSEMVFSFGDILEYISRNLTLYPGDIVSSGTAAGTAADSSPSLTGSSDSYFLKPGDRVDISSHQIGCLTVTIGAPDAVSALPS